MFCPHVFARLNHNYSNIYISRTLAVTLPPLLNGGVNSPDVTN
jgi:hypothetical protein